MPRGATLSNPYNNYVGGIPFPYTGTFQNGGGVFAVATDFAFPRTFQTNVSVQRQITKKLTAGVAYVGTISNNLPFGRDVNYPVLTPTATSAGANILSRRPNPAYGAVLVLDSDQNASYHGLQITGAMRFNKLKPSLKAQMKLWWDLVSDKGCGYNWGRSQGLVSYLDTLEIAAFLGENPEFRPAPLADIASLYNLAWRWIRAGYIDERHTFNIFAYGRGNYSYISLPREF